MTLTKNNKIETIYNLSFEFISFFKLYSLGNLPNYKNHSSIPWCVFNDHDSGNYEGRFLRIWFRPDSYELYITVASKDNTHQDAIIHRIQLHQ